MLLMSKQNKRRDADVGTKQKTMVVKKWSEQFSRHFIPILKRFFFVTNFYRPILALPCRSVSHSSCWILLRLLDLSELLSWFLEFVTWICQNWYMDLSKFLLGIVKVVLCISRPFPNKTKLKLTKISKFFEGFALKYRCWMSQSTQCRGSIVPLAVFSPYFSSFIFI